MISYGLPPNTSVMNQSAALAAWGAVAVSLCATLGRRETWSPNAGPTLLALAALMLGVVWAMFWNHLPGPLALLSIGPMFAAAVLFMVGVACREVGRTVHVISLLATGWLVLGCMLAMVCVIQVMAPHWADGDWIARTSLPGRAIGNMRQPNHVAMLLCWSCVSVLWLGATQRLGRAASTLLLSLFIFAMVLTASRTGLLGLLLLTAWGLADRRLPTSMRRTMVILVPLLLAASWLLTSTWLASEGHAVGAVQRMSEGAASPARMHLWRDVLELIKHHPLLGVGWGDFNLAWTLTPFARRTPAPFDHTHNLPLQLLVELGVPMGLGILLLLLCGIRLMIRSLRTSTGDEAVALRSAAMMLALVCLHSQLEFPLWYMYYLLPSALLWGICTGRSADPGAEPAGPSRLPATTLQWCAGLVIAAGLVMPLDYSRVTLLYDENLPPADLQFERAQQAWLFGTAADYAYATHTRASAQTLRAIKRAAHLIADARLLIAWAEALEATGNSEQASYLVARLREFQAPEARDWLRRCDVGMDAQGSMPRFCEPPARAYSFRDFL